MWVKKIKNKLITGWHLSCSFLATLKRLGTVLFKFLCLNIFYRCYCYILKLLQSFCKRLWHGLKVYANTGAITGTRYLFQPKYHYSERIFWAASLLLSVLLCSALLWNYATDFYNNVFKIVIEDRDVNVPLQFPSVSVCQTAPLLENTKAMDALNKNISILYPALKGGRMQRSNLLHNMFFVGKRKPDFLGDLSIFSSNQKAELEKLFREMDLESLADKIRSPCQEIFHKCIWDDKDFNCCKYFQVVKTMLGKCFILNSLQTKSGLLKNLPITRYSKKSSLEIQVHGDALFYIFNSNDIPEKITPFRNFYLPASADVKVDFTMTPMVNDDGIRTYNRNVTKCFLGPEPYLDHNKLVRNTYRHVSYSTCITDCIRYLQYTKCGCIHFHFNSDATVKHCDLEGYICLATNNIFINQPLFLLKDTICRLCLGSCDSNIIEVENYELSKF